jgi:hypothetical protein
VPFFLLDRSRPPVLVTRFASMRSFPCQRRNGRCRNFFRRHRRRWGSCGYPQFLIPQTPLPYALEVRHVGPVLAGVRDRRCSLKQRPLGRKRPGTSEASQSPKRGVRYENQHQKARWPAYAAQSATVVSSVRTGPYTSPEIHSRCSRMASFRATAINARFFAPLLCPASFNPQRRRSVSGPNGPSM